MSLSITIDGADFTAKWRLYESRWSSRAHLGEVAQSEFVFDDDLGDVGHPEVAARKIVEVWEDASGAPVCMYRGRIANKTLGRGTKLTGQAMRWKITTEDYNVDLRGIRVKNAVRPDETDTVRVEAIRLAFLNGAASTHPEARDSTDLDGTYIVAGADVNLLAETYTDTYPNDVLVRIAEVSGKNVFVYLEQDGTGELYYASYVDTSLVSDISITDDGTADSHAGGDIYAPYPIDAAGQHEGQQVITGGGIRFGDNLYVDGSDLAGTESLYDKWEEHITNEFVEHTSEADNILNKTVGLRDEIFSYVCIIDMRADQAHKVRAGQMVMHRHVAANKGSWGYQRAVQVQHEPLWPDEDGNAQYRVTVELGRPRGRPLRPNSRTKPGPYPNPPTVPGTADTVLYHLHWTGGVQEVVSVYPSGTGNWPPSAPRVDSAAGSDGESGFVSFKLSDTADGSPELPATAATTYRFDFDTRYGGDIDIRWLRADGTTISQQQLSHHTEGNVWIARSTTLTAPANTARMQWVPIGAGSYDHVRITIPTGTPTENPLAGDDEDHYALGDHEHVEISDRAPSVDDDDGSGYPVGTLWHVEGGTTYISVDSTDGAAVWELVDPLDEEAAAASSANLPQVIALTDAPDGGWEQYAKPVAAYSATTQRTYFAYISGDNGDACVRYYDHRAGTTSPETVIAAALELDDHAHPGVLVLDNGKILVWYHTHNDGDLWLRTSTNVEDISAFDAAVDIDGDLGGANYTYAFMAQLNDVTGNPLVLVVRPVSGGAGQYWSYSLSTDRGATWDALTQFTATTARTPYLNVTKTSESRLDFMLADGHSSTEDDISVFHFYYDGTADTFHKTDGTSAGTLPLSSPSEMTLVFDGDPGFDSRGGSVGLGSDGYPRAAFTVTPAAGEVHGYYGRWTGSAWSNTDVVDDLAEDGSDRFGAGWVIDPDSPARVWAARMVDSFPEIYELITTDGGDTFLENQITISSTVEQLHPHVPLDRSEALPVLWLTGERVDFTDWTVGTSGLLVSIEGSAGGTGDHDHDADYEPIGAVAAHEAGHSSGIGPILITSEPAGSPLVFADLMQNSEGTDLLYASEP